MIEPIYTYGDKVRRKIGGTVLTIQYIDNISYHFSDGSFLLIADQDCYNLVEKATGYFMVATDINDAPLNDYTRYGYDERIDFVVALRKLIERYGGRVGKFLKSRNGFLRLHFADMPGRITEDVWFPHFLLHTCSMPDYLTPSVVDPINQEIDEAFGFD